MTYANAWSMPPMISAFLPASPWLRQIGLQDSRADRVFRVDEIAEPHAPALAEHHIGVPAIEAVFRLHPQHELAIGNARGVLERACAADAHDELFPLQPRPVQRPALDDIDADCRGG